MSDEAIHEHWAQVRADAERGALETRKATLLTEIEEIEAKLKALVEKGAVVVEDAAEEVEKVVKEVVADLEGKSAAKAPVPKKNGKPASA